MPDPIAFASPEAWRAWLAENHASQSEVWVLYYKKGSGIASIDWPQAVVEALAWGWIDGIRKSIDETRWMQRFTPRKAGSVWSEINRVSADRLIAEGRMQEPGLRQVEIAKQNGKWELAYSGGKTAKIPQDFLDALAAAPQSARDMYARLENKHLYSIYYRLTTAKRPETRAKRIRDFIAKLERGEVIV